MTSQPWPQRDMQNRVPEFDSLLGNILVVDITRSRTDGVKRDLEDSLHRRSQHVVVLLGNRVQDT